MSDNKRNGRHRSEMPLPGHENGSNGAMSDELSPEQLAHIWEMRAQALAKPPPAQIGGETLNLITFLMGGERYGIDIDYVREVRSLAQITPIPRTPVFVAGVMGIRGRVVSVLDLCAFFGLPGVEISDESKILVVTTNAGSQQESNGMEVGLLTDEVEGTLTIHEADLEPPLATRKDVLAEFSLGIAPGPLLVLDLNALLNSKRIVVNDELS